MLLKIKIKDIILRTKRLFKMPVVTRNQRKNMQKSASKSVNDVSYIEHMTLLSKINHLLDDFEGAKDKSVKIQTTTQVYNIINDNLENLLNRNTLMWVRFAATAYNMTTEYEEDRIANYYDDVDPNLVTTFTNAYMKARKFLSSFFKNLRNSGRIVMINPALSPYDKMFKNIDDEEEEMLKKKSQNVTVRPKRKIPTVDYSGMV